MPENGWQVGIDIGGTFTDLVALLARTGEVRSIKVPTERNDPVASILVALAAADLTPEMVADLIHGTTLVTNAIVEDRVEPVALVATQLRGRARYRPRRPPSALPARPAAAPRGAGAGRAAHRARRAGLSHRRRRARAGRYGHRRRGEAC